MRLPSRWQRVRDWILPALALMIVVAAIRSTGPAHASQGPTRQDGTTLRSAPDQFFTSGSAQIRYRVIGNGAPVLLLHGYTDRVEMWAAMADSLASTYRVIVPDVRGFGLSTKSGQLADYGRHMVTDQVALLDHLRIPRVNVVGYSMGAVLAANLAALVPSRVSTASLIAGPFFPDSTSLARVLEPHVRQLENGQGLLSFFRYILPTWPDSLLVPAVKQVFDENDHPSLVASIRAFPGLMLDSATVSRLSTPALAIIGIDDRALLDASAWIARHWRGARHVVLPRGDHADIAQLPEVITEVRQLLARSLRTTAAQ